MTFRQLLAIVWARRAPALALFVVVVVGALAVSLLLPREYRAYAAVMIDGRTTDPLAAPGTGPAGGGAGYMATQVDLIQSERVALRAARALGVDRDPAWQRAWRDDTGGRGDRDAWIAERLAHQVHVQPARESNVVSIGYASGDPAFAAAAANAVVRAYTDTTLELKVEPARQYNAFFDERARQLRTALEQAQAKLSEYQREKGIVATDERLDVEQARLSELSSQVVTLQGQAAESSSRQGQAGASSQEVVSNVLIGNIVTELSRQEGRLTELRQRLGERHPMVIEVNAAVTQLRERLQTETRRISGSLDVNNRVDRSRLAVAQSALAAQRARVLQLRGQRDEASVLLRDVDSAQRGYDATLARVTQSNLESRNTFTNIAVLKAATPPAFAASPRTRLNVGVAAAVGALLAVALAVLLERADRRLRFDSDVVDAIGQPLLMVLPSRDGTPTRPARLVPEPPALPA